MFHASSSRHRASSGRFRICFPVVLAVSLVAGCTSDSKSKTEQSVDIPSAPARSKSTSIADLRAALGANENAEFAKRGDKIFRAKLENSGVTDLEPLRGVPLTELDLFNLPIDDLSPLQGMELEYLYLEGTQVSDISPLQGMPLQQLYLQNTNVSDLSPLNGMPLRMLNLKGCPIDEIDIVSAFPLKTLWIPETQVRDLTPLAAMSLESLDIEGTPVDDLLPLAEMTSLRRLNLARSAVTDLRPLKGLALNRLLLTPSRIQHGLDVARSMSSLQEIGPDFQRMMRPDQFWRVYDAGQLVE